MAISKSFFSKEFFNGTNTQNKKTAIIPKYASPINP
jgi:hypothetical protein